MKPRSLPATVSYLDRHHHALAAVPGHTPRSAVTEAVDLQHCCIQLRSVSLEVGAGMFGGGGSGHYSPGDLKASLSDDLMSHRSILRVIEALPD